MAIEDIFRALEEQADRECRDILDSAKATAKSVEAGAKTEAETIKADKIATADASVRTKASQLVNAAKLANMKDMAAAKDRGIARVYDSAREQLGALRGTPAYAALFKALMEEALSGVSSADVVVKVDPADEGLARTTLGELGLSYEVDASLPTVGGLVVLTSGGRIRRRNTLEDRLGKVRTTRQAEVAEILFG
jgi:vacuolar-type H+-ATPase subunit E/Vma4